MKNALVLLVLLVATTTACVVDGKESTDATESYLTAIALTTVDTYRGRSEGHPNIEVSPDGRTVAYERDADSRVKDLTTGTSVDIPRIEERTADGYLARAFTPAGYETRLYDFDGALQSSLLLPDPPYYALDVQVRQTVVSRVRLARAAAPNTLRFELTTPTGGSFATQPFTVESLMTPVSSIVYTTDGARVAVVSRRSAIDPTQYVSVSDAVPGAQVVQHQVVVDGSTLDGTLGEVHVFETSEDQGNVLFRTLAGHVGALDIGTGVGRWLNATPGPVGGLVTRGPRVYWHDGQNVMSWDRSTPNVAPTTIRPFVVPGLHEEKHAYRLSDDGEFYLESCEVFGTEDIVPKLRAFPLDPLKPVQELVGAPGWLGGMRGRAAIGPAGKIAVAAADRYEAVDLHTGTKWQGTLPPHNKVVGLAWSHSGDALGILHTIYPNDHELSLALRIVRDDGERDKVVTTTATWGTDWSPTNLYAAYDDSFLVASQLLRDPAHQFSRVLVRAHVE